MKFTVLTDFKAKGFQFETGNSHDSQKLGVEDERVERWYRAGFVQIEGRDPAPAPNPNHVELAPAGMKSKGKTKNK